ncbi:HAD-IIIC family phosphatase [Chitinispirillales bacterium ANBcel5]|uniref:HAD-IIIC family phosphatase n=1 Tax=Cellulosispirillum alkaliphilum TaxID=3039283 RepID=UPI002A51D29A|nr:HAD-IIIC family phosphatase [Chitinispirillales bacterium ANBcel5]
MWEPEFANKRLWKSEKSIPEKVKSRLGIKDVNRVKLLYWREHCLECSPPECYHTCPIYAPRKDKRCVRVNYGLYPNPHFSGLLPYGIDVRFKKWAKLGTSLYNASLSPSEYRKIAKIDILMARFVNAMYRISNPFNPLEWFRITFRNPQRNLYKLHTLLREKVLTKIKSKDNDFKPDCFVMECYSFYETSFKLQIEHSKETIIFRDSVLITPGHNYREIPIKNFNSTGSITIYPENDLNVRMVFTWLDFVEKKTSNSLNPKKEEKPAEKVKCVAWDLDNTLWNGTLIEDGESNMVIPQEHIEVIKKLDERGIIQTVTSKNNYEEAWSVLEKYGIEQYFIYPAINWAPKSENLSTIAKKINIDLNTFAIIDDSAFERAEIKASHPQVRLYSDKEVLELLQNPEFDVPVTDASKMRRISYLNQVQRERVKEQFSGDYTTFLKECRMELEIFRPLETKHKHRCLELVQRSNQLNLSSRRYSAEEFEELLGKKGYLCLALQCRDKFGEYGIIGFCSIDQTARVPRIMDFVISCRVAQKKVEHTFIEWLGRNQKQRGCSSLELVLVRTKKNGPLVRVFQELPFEEKIVEEDKSLLTLKLEKISEQSDIIRIVDKTITDEGVIC